MSCSPRIDVPQASNQQQACTRSSRCCSLGLGSQLALQLGHRVVGGQGSQLAGGIIDSKAVDQGLEG